MGRGCFRRAKAEAPLATDADIEGLVTAFEECRWPHRHWTHRAHLAVALVYVSRYGYPVALDRARVYINLYNRTIGQPDGYHETLTALFLWRVEKYLREEVEPKSLVAALEELTTLCDMQWPLRYFSPERLWSDEAKARWVAPDREPLEL